jgi:hypothetical protein
MKNSRNIILILCFGVFTTMCSKESKDKNPTGPSVPDATGEVTVSKIEYNGWNDSYDIENGMVKVVVVPAIGRIMHYSFANDDNILWHDPSYYGKTLPYGKALPNNEWANFGGDKVWPTEQSQFPAINGHGWPPDHWFDGGAHQAEEIPNGVKITSQVSKYCGAFVTREITLDPNSSELLIKQTIKKVRAAEKSSVEPIDFTIWNVTQIRSPQMALLNLNPASSLPNRIHTWSQEAASNLSISGDVAAFLPGPSSQKVGADSDHWLGAIVGDVVIGEFFRLQSGTYPDGGLSAEVYTEPRYTELELLSPFAALNIGEETRFDISLRLHKLSSSSKTAAQKRSAAVEWLNSFNQ